MKTRTLATTLLLTCASFAQPSAQGAGTLIGQVGVQMVIGAGCTIIDGSPAVSEKRLSLTANGSVRYQLKMPYRDGTTHVISEPA